MSNKRDKLKFQVLLQFTITGYIAKGGNWRINKTAGSSYWFPVTLNFKPYSCSLKAKTARQLHTNYTLTYL